MEQRIEKAVIAVARQGELDLIKQDFGCRPCHALISPFRTFVGKLVDCISPIFLQAKLTVLAKVREAAR
jgi:hypothetical protein